MNEAGAAAAEKKKVTRIGVVESTKRAKTLRVAVQFRAMHPKYGKYVRKRTLLHVHDESNEARTGDRVEIAECRPRSKTKSWELIRIVDRAPEAA